MVDKVNILRGNKVSMPKETVYESGIEGPMGIALASIRESEPHYHDEMTEYYMVTKGRAIAYLDGQEMKLQPYDVLEIKPKTIHYVKAKRNRLLPFLKNKIELWVISYPPWKIEDHHKV